MTSLHTFTPSVSRTVECPSFLRSGSLYVKCEGGCKNSGQTVSSSSHALDALGTEPVFIREGGSIPIVGLIKQHLGVDTLLLGWGQNDDNLHGPNEKFAIADFHRGIKASAHLFEELANESTG